jgi:hypothetical protein
VIDASRFSSLIPGFLAVCVSLALAVAIVASKPIAAAGVRHARVCDLHHTYTTSSLATGVDIFTLARGWARGRI